jgi:hypothetical protein
VSSRAAQIVDTITIYPGIEPGITENAKEGGSFVHIQSILVDA